MATAIAVCDGQVLEVGTPDSIASRGSTGIKHTIDDAVLPTKVILPGFIDPHLHPSMAAVILPMHFITALQWDLPWESVPATKTHDAYLARLERVDPYGR